MQHTERNSRRGESRIRGLLFARGYNEKLLLRSGQLDAWLNYLSDNPRRLLMKHGHPDLFRVKRDITTAGITISSLGNLFLLDRPVKLQVQCSRSLTESQINDRVAQCLVAARAGAVLVSPAIFLQARRLL